jgi:hypothetical protein
VREHALGKPVQGKSNDKSLVPRWDERAKEVESNDDLLEEIKRSLAAEHVRGRKDEIILKSQAIPPSSGLPGLSRIFIPSSNGTLTAGANEMLAS